jgi:hypothetical protein
MLYTREQQIVDPLSTSLLVLHNFEVLNTGRNTGIHQGNMAVTRHSKQRKRTGEQHDSQYSGVLALGMRGMRVILVGAGLEPVAAVSRHEFQALG